MSEVFSPNDTCYAFEVGLVSVGIGEFLSYVHDSSPGEPRFDKARIFLGRLLDPWRLRITRVPETEFIYFWYSLRVQDRACVHNPSCLLAKAMMLYASVSPLADGASFRDLAERYAAYLWSTLFMKEKDELPAAPSSAFESGGWLWYYEGHLAPRRTPEDISHATHTIQFMKFSKEQGWMSSIDLLRVCRTLKGIVWRKNPIRLFPYVTGRLTKTIKFPNKIKDREPEAWNYTRKVAVSYFTLARDDLESPVMYELGKSILYSSILSEYAYSESQSNKGKGEDTNAFLAMSTMLINRPAIPLDRQWSVTAGTDDSVRRTTGSVRFISAGTGGEWSAVEATAFNNISLPSRTASSACANFAIDFPAHVACRAAISVTYYANKKVDVEQYRGRDDGYSYCGELPASRNERGDERWFRTTFAIKAENSFDYDPEVDGTTILFRFTKPVIVHRIEVTGY